MYSILLIVDLQLDFCSRGALPVPGADNLVPQINQQLHKYHFVLATQDWHPVNHTSFASQHPGRACFEKIQLSYGEQELWPNHCVQETQGAFLHPDLDQSMIHGIIRKGYHQNIDSYSAFFENDHKTATALMAMMSPQKCKLDICGVAREYCVEYTYQDAQKLGYQVKILEGLCAGFTK